MKKYIAGIIVGIIFTFPISASAWNQKQLAQPLYGADCRNRWVTEKAAEHPEHWDCSVTIYVFDDAGNKCYLAKGSNGTGLSCVKQ